MWWNFFPRLSYKSLWLFSYSHLFYFHCPLLLAEIYEANCHVLDALFCCLVVKICLTNPKDYISPSSSIHGISQERILEWIAISFSRNSSNPGMEPASHALQVDSLLLNHQGSRLSCSYYNELMTASGK